MLRSPGEIWCFAAFFDIYFWENMEKSLPFFGAYGIVKIVKEVFDIFFVLYYNHNTNTCLDGGLGYGER